MGILSHVRTILRNITNHVRRPSSVTAAQHRHLLLNPDCVACGSRIGGQAHHIKPYNKFPELAADPDNFITLCEHPGGLECHLNIGHGGLFSRYNPDVVLDAARFRQAPDPGRRIILDNIRAKRQVDAV